MWQTDPPPAVKGSRRPLPSEDYYSVDYEPTALLNEWDSLQREFTAALVAMQSVGPASPNDAEKFIGRHHDQHGRHKQSATPSTSRRRGSAAREAGRPRSSLALELHYARRSQQALGGVPGSSVSSPSDVSRSSSAASSSSTTDTETARQQRRYQNVHTAYAQVSDPYDRSREIARQEQFLSESRRLGRAFVPVGGNRGAPTRLLLGDCVRNLYKCVQRDWPKAEPMVVSTAEDLIVVFFSLHGVSKRRTAAVLEYMNAFAKRNETVREFRLSKVREGWDLLTEDGHLMYTFQPPWVTKGKRFLPDTINPSTAHVRC